MTFVANSIHPSYAWGVTNDLPQDSEPAVQEVCGMRLKIERFHRELKQTTGIEKNPCRKARMQRDYIACAMLVWLRLTDLARQTGKTVYRIKQGLLDDYLCQQRKNPSVKMRFASVILSSREEDPAGGGHGTACARRGGVIRHGHEPAGFCKFAYSSVPFNQSPPRRFHEH